MSQLKCLQCKEKDATTLMTAKYRHWIVELGEFKDEKRIFVACGECWTKVLDVIEKKNGFMECRFEQLH
jgi:Fe-S-cluster formation regulator IscX/YfhJ